MNEARLRRLILGLFCVGVTGTGVELVALAHYEDQWQLVPIFVLALALVSAALQTIAASRLTVRLLKTVCVVMILSGIAGIILHYRGNLEFQLEIDPQLAGWELFSKIIHAKAPPALAPGVMAQLGLLGLIYGFRHPLTRREAGV